MGIIIEHEDCIGYLPARPLSVSVKGPCQEHEGDNGILLPLGTPESVRHRADVGSSDYDGNNSDASSSTEPNLTDTSADDENGVQGGRVKRLVKGFEKMRRVRRKPLPPTQELSDEDGPPGLNPSSDEDCPASDERDSEIKKVEVRVGQNWRRRRAIQRFDSGGDFSQE